MSQLISKQERMRKAYDVKHNQPVIADRDERIRHFIKTSHWPKGSDAEPIPEPLGLPRVDVRVCPDCHVTLRLNVHTRERICRLCGFGERRDDAEESTFEREGRQA